MDNTVCKDTEKRFLFAMTEVLSPKQIYEVLENYVGVLETLEGLKLTPEEIEGVKLDHIFEEEAAKEDYDGRCCDCGTYIGFNTTHTCTTPKHTR